MPAYAYLAFDHKSKKTKGLIEADSAKIARQKIRQLGLLPTEVNEITENINTTKTQFVKLAKLSSHNMVLATQQLATLLQAKLTVEESLSALIEQSESEKVKRAFAALRSEVRAGHSLSRAVKQYPNVFPEIYGATIRAGEESGNLAAVMLKLAEYLEKRQAVTRKILSAFAYPIIVCLVAILVIIALFIFVVPQVVSVFESTNAQLPLITQIMLTTSSLLKSYGIISLIFVTLIWLGFTQAIKIKGIRNIYHQNLLKIPILKKVLLSSDAVRLTNTLAILVSSGVPLLSSINAAADNLILIPLKNAMNLIIEDIREGKSFSKALESSKKFPPVLTYLIRSGETTGDLSQMLERAAKQQENELDSRLSLLTTILGPLLIVIMGVIVGTIILSVLIPISEINQLVR